MILHRLFYGLQLPAPERVRAGRYRDKLEDMRYQVINDRLHLTLAITDDYEDFPAAEAYELHAFGGEVRAEPVTVSLERLSASERSVALRPGRASHELRALQKALHERMMRSKLLRTAWKFNPHVTLGYRKGRPFTWPIEPITWESHEFVLIHSEVGASRHHTLGRWPLYRRQGKLF